MEMRNEVSFDHLIPVSGSVSGLLIGLLGSLGKLPVPLRSHKLTFKLSGSWHDLINSSGLLTFDNSKLTEFVVIQSYFRIRMLGGLLSGLPTLGCYPRNSLT